MIDKVTDEQKAELREALYEILCGTRGIFRPSELSRTVSHDPRFMLWATCHYVSWQLIALAKQNKVRKAWTPLGGPVNSYVFSLQIQPGYRGYCVKAMDRKELERFSQVSSQYAEPLTPEQWTQIKAVRAHK